jgi:histidinol-phosphatase
MKSEFLATALEAAEAATQVIQRHYRGNIVVRAKADKSPVTIADVEAEKAIRAVLETRFPEHGFYGEETGEHAPDAEYLWLVDPIDGTKAFVREYPMFSTQIALMRRGELIVGVSSASEYGELAYAEKGRGAWLDGKPISVSKVDRVEKATLSIGNVKSMALGSRWSRFGALVGRVDRTRGYGDFLHYHLLAAGKIDAVIESDVNILDIAALAAIVEEAGGRFTDLEGRPVTLTTTSVLATNGRLHQSILDALGY